MTRIPRLAAALAVLCALAALAAVLRSPASAQTPTTRLLTFTELERGGTFTHIRNTKGAPRRANLAGDVIVFTNPLADASGARVGTSWVSCTTTGGARNFMKSTLTCSGVLTFADGTLTLQANTSPASPTTTGAVTGGTGAYANARGVFVSEEGPNGARNTVTLAG